MPQYAYLIWLIFCSYALFCQDITPDFSIKKYDHIHCALSKQCFNAHCVITMLWQLPLDEFDCACSALFSRYSLSISSLKPSLYQPFVKQCKIMHSFFSHLFVDQQTNSLVYFVRDVPFDFGNDIMLPVFTCWRLKGNVSYQTFYASYFDGVSRLFVASVNDTYNHKNDRSYNDYFVKTARYYDELHMIYELLADSIYERRYGYQLQRYQELIALLGAL